MSHSILDDIAIMGDQNLDEMERLHAIERIGTEHGDAGRNALFEAIPTISGSEWFIWRVVMLLGDVDDPRVSDSLLVFHQRPADDLRIERSAAHGLAKKKHKAAYLLAENYLLASQHKYKAEIGAEVAEILADARLLPNLKQALVEHPEISEPIARAMDAIRKAYPQSRDEIVAALQEQLAKDIHGVQCFIVLREIGTPKALEAAQAWQHAAKDYLIALFSSSDEDKHLEAMYFLYNNKFQLEEIVTADPILRDVGIPIIIANLRDYLAADQSSQEIPAGSLETIADSRVTEELIGMLEWGPLLTRYYVIYALAGLGDARAVPALLNQLAHPEPHQRDWADRGLSIFFRRELNSEDKELAFQALEQALSDRTQVDDNLRVCDIALRLIKQLR